MRYRSALLLATTFLFVVGCGGDTSLSEPGPSPAASPSPSPSPSPTLEESPPPSPTDTPTKEPPPKEPKVSKADLQKMAITFREYVSAYNSGNYSQALSLIDRAAVNRECGSPSRFARALRQNYQIERLDYELVRVGPGMVPQGQDVRADVYFNSFDPQTGQQFDFKLGIGLLFTKTQGRWILGEPFPLGATAFC